MYVPIYKCQLVRTARTKYDGRQAMNNTMKAISITLDLTAPLLRDSPQEQFLVITLDTKLKPIGVHPITQGTLDASLVHPREVFRTAILDNSSAIIAVHNHPSGDLAASSQDKELTTRLVEVGKLLGIAVLDHMIVGTDDDGKFWGVSLRENYSELW